MDDKPLVTLPTRGYFILALILPVFALAPLTYPGYIQTHAGFLPVWNVADLRANLGNLGWVPHLGLRFDPLRGDGLLAYYVAALLPLEPVVAVKVVTGLAWWLGGVGVFVWLRRWLGEAGGLVASLVYVYLPFQIATVYVRGAWGETLFWGLLPWAMLAVVTLCETKPLSLRRGAVLFVAATILWLTLGFSQGGLTLWAMVLAVLGTLLLYPMKVWRVLLIVALLALVSYNSAVPLPDPPVMFSAHYLEPFQLLSPTWGFGISRAGWDDGLSFSLGFAGVALTLVTLRLWYQSRPLDPALRWRLVVFGAGVTVLILLQFGLADVFWQVRMGWEQTFATLLTYPWQLLGFVGLGLAFLAGASLQLEARLTSLPLLASLIIIVLLASYRYLAPQFLTPAQFREQPRAVMGDNDLAVLDYDLRVAITGHTPGLPRSEAVIPLAVHGPVEANDQLNVEITWQTLSPLSEDWKVFVHLLDSSGNRLAQFDGFPAAPTSAWVPGALITEVYPVRLPAELPAAPHQLAVGLYNEATFARLAVPGDDEGRVLLSLEE